VFFEGPNDRWAPSMLPRQGESQRRARYDDAQALRARAQLTVEAGERTARRAFEEWELVAGGTPDTEVLLKLETPEGIH
jgi:hypothetical protein